MAKRPMARERRKVKLVMAAPPAAPPAAPLEQSCKVFVISSCDWKLSLCGRGDKNDENADLHALDTGRLQTALGHCIFSDCIIR